MKYFNVVVWVLIVTAVYMACTGCESLRECPVCEECSEGVEDPYLCSKYYADKEELQTLFGSHDFFLKEDISLVATKCLTCGIHFTHPSYGEHIKTCCP